jgi:hypothetical protein
MGKLLDEIQKQKPKKTGTSPKIDLLLTKLSKQDAQDLLVALADETIQSEIISRVLIKNGHNISRQCVARFRKQNL